MKLEQMCYPCMPHQLVRNEYSQMCPALGPCTENLTLVHAIKEITQLLLNVSYILKKWVSEGSPFKKIIKGGFKCMMLSFRI